VARAGLRRAHRPHLTATVDGMADLAHASEGRTGLHGDPDASHWAERFRAKWIIVTAPGPGETIPGFRVAEERTEGVMLAWFASAIETGRMAQG
jgi:hypothetical protein